MTIKEALDYCKTNKDAVARRPCWDDDNMKRNESIFWHAREEAFCYYYFIDADRVIPLPRGWDDNPRYGTPVGMVSLADALADDWIVINKDSRERIYFPAGDSLYDFADNDQFAGGFIDGRADDCGYSQAGTDFHNFDFTL